MTASERRRPVTASDFNRLLFALLLLAALAVLARLVTRQESRAEVRPEDEITLAQWVQTADALFLKGEWTMAADAYFSALEVAAREGLPAEPRWQKKLSLCLAESQDHRGALHFMRLYRLRLLECQRDPSLASWSQTHAPVDAEALARELAETEGLIQRWEAQGA
jgi:hypothetical protein